MGIFVEKSCTDLKEVVQMHSGLVEGENFAGIPVFLDSFLSCEESLSRRELELVIRLQCGLQLAQGEGFRGLVGLRTRKRVQIGPWRCTLRPIRRKSVFRKEVEVPLYVDF